MFKEAGFLSRMVTSRLLRPSGEWEDVIERFPIALMEPPTSPLTIWRGASLSSQGRGMSWTQFRDCAVTFAQAWADIHQGGSGLFRAVVPPAAVLAMFRDEREDEVVVNPNMLRGRVSLVDAIGESPESAARKDALRKVMAGP